MTITLFALAFALRLIAVLTPAIWYDEAYSLYTASLPISQIIAVKDFTPPLWEIILHPFVTLWPHIITTRLIALVFSMLSMFVAYLIMEDLKFTRAQTTLALAIIAALPGLTWMSSDGRAYALYAFLILVGALAVLKKNNVALFAVSAVMLYTHVTSVFFIAALFITAYLRGEMLRKLATLGAGLALIWTPWVFVMVDILTTPTGANPYDPITLNYFLAEFSAAFWIGSPAWLYLSGFVLSLVTLAMRPKQSALILAPVLVMALVSMLGFTLITYRTISLIIIPIALLIGYAFADRPLGYAWMIVIVVSAITYKYDAKGSTQLQAVKIIQAKPAPVVYATLTVALPFEYYLQADDSCLLLLQPDASFGLDRCTPENLAAPYWFIMPEEPLIPRPAYQQMQSIAANGTLEHHLQFFQTAPVNVYFVKE